MGDVLQSLPCDARRTSRSERHKGSPNTRRSESHPCCRFETARWHCQILAFAYERQAVLDVIPIDADQVAKMYLIRGKQIGKWIDNMTLNGPLEMPRTIALVRAFLK